MMSAGDDLYHGPSQDQVEALRDLATKLRVASVKMTQASKSGHPTSCSSMAELMSVLFFRVMKYKDPRVHKEQRDPANDRFVPVLDYITPLPMPGLCSPRVTRLPSCTLPGPRPACSLPRSC